MCLAFFYFLFHIFCRPCQPVRIAFLNVSLNIADLTFPAVSAADDPDFIGKPERAAKNIPIGICNSRQQQTSFSNDCVLYLKYRIIPVIFLAYCFSVFPGFYYQYRTRPVIR